MLLHVRFAFWYIYLPFPAKQQRQMIKLQVCEESEYTTVNFPFTI